MRSLVSLLGRGPAGAGDVARLGALGLVRVVGTGVDLQLVELSSAESVLRDHAPHCAGDELDGVVIEQLGVALRLEAARVAGVAIRELGFGLVGRHHDLVGVDDDDVVAGVQVRCVVGTVLATQQAGRFGGQPQPVLAGPQRVARLVRLGDVAGGAEPFDDLTQHC